MIFFENASKKRPYFYVTTLQKNTVLLYWKYKLTGEDLSQHTISIYRSPSETDEGVKIGEVSAVQTYYKDNSNLDLSSPQRFYYYQIQIDDRPLTDKVTLDRQPDARTNYLRKNGDTLLKMGGSPVLYYQRIQSGDRCSECWDSHLGVTKANCPICFGTGFAKGFSTPVLTMARVIPPAKLQVQQEVDTYPQKTSIVVSYFPLSNSKDVIYEINTDKFWEILSIEPIHTKSSLISQNLTVKRINFNDIEYTLPMPDQTMEWVINPPKHSFFIDINKIKEYKNAE